jgi:hypothetical protein
MHEMKIHDKFKFWRDSREIGGLFEIGLQLWSYQRRIMNKNNSLDTDWHGWHDWYELSRITIVRTNPKSQIIIDRIRMVRDEKIPI